MFTRRALLSSASFHLIFLTSFALAIVAAPLGKAGRGQESQKDERPHGPVRRVRIEVAPLINRGGLSVEGPRKPVRTETYDLRGNKVDGDTKQESTGAEQKNYTYDAKGNPIEMTARDADGQVLRKELYSYEFDKLGNWTKRITSIGIIENDKMATEPVEVTYRYITYYLIGEAARQYASPLPASPRNAAASAVINSVASKRDAAERNAGTQAIKMNGGDMTARGATVSLPAVPSPEPTLIDEHPAAVTIKQAETKALPSTSAARPLPGIEKPPAAAVTINPATKVPSTTAPASPNASSTPPLKRLEISSASKAKLRDFQDKAEAEYKAGRYANAITAYLSAIEIDPNDPVIYNNLAVSYIGLKKYKEALPALKLAVSIAPQDPGQHYRLGYLYYLLQRYREASNELREVIRLQPDSSQAHFALGVTSIMLRERAAANEQVTRLSKLDPKLARELASYISKMDDPDSAERVLKICQLLNCH